jgi:hypothetical protein
MEEEEQEVGETWRTLAEMKVEGEEKFNCIKVVEHLSVEGKIRKGLLILSDYF